MKWYSTIIIINKIWIKFEHKHYINKNLYIEINKIWIKLENKTKI